MTSPVREHVSEKAERESLAPISDPNGRTLHGHHPDRAYESQFVDDLELLRIERMLSNVEKENGSRYSKSVNRRHQSEPEDAFHTMTQPAAIPETKPAKPSTFLSRLWIRLKKFPRVFRYFVYAIPVAALLLTPILLDIFAFPDQDNPVGGDGGLRLLWFGIWLEVLWCGLWVSRIIVAMLPLLLGNIAKVIGSSNHKKWKDIGRQMEIPTSVFIWMLAVMVSYTPITSHQSTTTGDWSDGAPSITWINVVYKVIIALFVLAVSNWLEKILIQWIATSFHQRTYAYRIEQNKAETNFLIQLYELSKKKGVHHDTTMTPGSQSGTKTPMKKVKDQIGNMANKMAGDITGRKVLSNTHPQKVVLELLRNTSSSHTLARIIYRALAPEDQENITPEDLKHVFESPDDAEACFGMFDKDLNGDISMEELELVCNEIHLERKAIAASLKDLDSVIKNLDQVFLCIIFIIAIIVFISILSGSAAAALGTSGTTILGLSWMLQATAQEFLQSIIFVFVKHPFDVGDRVTVYGNTGSLGIGDDYYVVEISLLYTEFKKMEGHIVQAPNSLLNTLFILNQRRSNGLADPIELKLKFGTDNAVIEELKARMLDFVLENKRDYAPRVISEVRTIDEVYSVTMNLIFFHKSNYQNELLRLQRHNRFAAELMSQIKQLGIEGPRKHAPGGTRDFPVFWSAVQPPTYSEHIAPAQPGAGGGGSSLRTASPPGPSTVPSVPSHLSSPEKLRRRRAESRVRQHDDGPDFQDVFDNRKEPMSLARLQSLREEENNGQSSGLERLHSRSSAAGSGFKSIV